MRQRPGPRNALGLVKFVFPNDDNVYLHNTPSQSLLSRSRRDFSHGCVRVEDPIKLAEWALQGQEGWTHDRIVAAVGDDHQLRVTLTQPIQVLLFYVTAVVMPEGPHGALRRGHLRARRPARQGAGGASASSRRLRRRVAAALTARSLPAPTS